MAPQCTTRPSPPHALPRSRTTTPPPVLLISLFFSRYLAVLPPAALISLRLGPLCASCSPCSHPLMVYFLLVLLACLFLQVAASRDDLLRAHAQA
ncbi:hypothetical protein BJV78DRAFT_796362 [Lactifluus subvellereus]|nr:hypothetical protein BJV78DRAFT_796362 [Lactifluus subvellereus]